MRRVLPNFDTVFHYWANRVQPYGECGNVSFDGARLYSYRACIGRHLPNGVVAITSTTYSVTTTRHTSIARRAAHGRIIRVPDPDDLHSSLNACNRRIGALLEQASIAKSRKPFYLSEAMSIANDFAVFAEALGSDLRVASFGVTDADLESVRLTVKARKAEEAKRAKDRAEREAIEAAESIARWRNGEPAHVPYSLTLLRLKDDEVQTSRGATIPVEHARRLWPLIRRCVRSGNGLTPGDRTVHLGVYRLTRIRPDGSVVAGCHDIAYAEIEGIARQLGLTMDQPEEIAA